MSPITPSAQGVDLLQRAYMTIKRLPKDRAWFAASVDVVRLLHAADLDTEEALADMREAAVTDALDRLIMSGIDVAELHRDDVYGRAFDTFSPGSETIRPEVAKRLARINATIWIDAEL